MDRWMDGYLTRQMERFPIQLDVEAEGESQMFKKQHLLVLKQLLLQRPS